jgi:hypothetical protein
MMFAIWQLLFIPLWPIFAMVVMCHCLGVVFPASRDYDPNDWKR